MICHKTRQLRVLTVESRTAGARVADERDAVALSVARARVGRTEIDQVAAVTPWRRMYAYMYMYEYMCFTVLLCAVIRWMGRGTITLVDTTYSTLHLPSYPWWHWHRKLPTVLTQSACGPHGALSHSFTSSSHRLPVASRTCANGDYILTPEHWRCAVYAAR